MSAIRGACVASLLACLAGCGLRARIPEADKGDTPLHIENWLDAKICSVSFQTPDELRSGAPANNWMGSLIKISPGGGQVFNVKPGMYAMTIGSCDNDGAHFHEQKNAFVSVRGPTYVSIGRMRHPGPAGYTSERIMVVGNVGDYVPPVYTNTGGGGGGGGGEQEPAAEGGEAASEPESSSSSSSSSSSDSSSSSSSSHSSPAPAAAPRDCKPLGASVGYSHECCSDATKLSPDHTRNLCCDHSSDSACS